MADYIPGPDADFNSWQDNFVACANLAELGLVAGQDARPTPNPED